MRVIPEYACSVAAKDYLTSALDAVDFVEWPICEYFDPMAQDESNRVVCIVESADTEPESTGQFQVELQVGVKTQWAQPSVEADRANHFDRVNQVRDALCGDMETLVTALNSVCPTGFAIHGVNLRRQFTTAVNQGNYYSDVKLTIQAHATT